MAKARAIPVHRYDGCKTPFKVTVVGRNGVVAYHYAPTWERAKEMVDIAKVSSFCLNAFAENAETDEIY